MDRDRVRDDDDRIEREGFLPVRGGRNDRSRWDLHAIQFLGLADDPSPPPNILTGPIYRANANRGPIGPYYRMAPNWHHPSRTSLIGRGRGEAFFDKKNISMGAVFVAGWQP